MMEIEGMMRLLYFVFGFAVGSFLMALAITLIQNITLKDENQKEK